MFIIKTDCFAIQRAKTLVGNNVITKLQEFYDKSNRLENDYKQYALVFIKETLAVNHSGETKKALTNLLLEIGFKKSNVTKMIGSQQFISEQERTNSKATDALKALPVSSSYALSTCSEDTFLKIWTGPWEFGENKITRDEVVTMKTKHEKVSREKTVENSQPSNLEKARKLLTDYPELIKQIDELLGEEWAEHRG